MTVASVWASRLLRVVVGLIAAAVFLLTFSQLIPAGSNVFRDFGIATTRYAWPTFIGLVAVITAASVRPKNATSSHILVTAAGAWLLSGLVYVLAIKTSLSASRLVVIALVSGAPIATMYGTLLLMNRLSWRQPTRLAIGGALTMVLSWLVVPTWLILACLLAGDCL